MQDLNKKTKYFTNINNSKLIKLEKYLINEAKFYPSSTKEWLTSSYSYNKTNFQNLPVKDKIVYNLLKSYFNLKQDKIRNVLNNVKLNKGYSLSSFVKKRLKNKHLSLFLKNANKLGPNLHILKEWKKSLIKDQEKLNKQFLTVNHGKDLSHDLLPLQKISNNSKRYLLILKQRLLKKIRIQEKKKKLFLKKTYLSLPEIKHLNNKSIITVSIYNRNNQILKKKIYKIYKMFILKKRIKENLTIFSSLKVNNYLALNQFKKNTLKKYIKISLYKKIYLNLKITLKNSLKFNSNELSLVNTSYSFSDVKKINLKKLKRIKKILQKKYKKLIKYKYLIMLLSFYRFRLNNMKLLGLKNIARKIYGKKIVFRIINLKYMYLDSNILAEAITKKLRDRKKRIIRVLKKVMENIKKVSLIKNLWEDNFTNKNLKENKKISLNNVKNEIFSKLAIKNLISNEHFLNKSDEKQKNQKTGIILYNLKHKIVSGIKVQGSGRLTKRLTASRSLTKFRSKGSLKNINSSRYGLSNVMIRGYLKSNLQYVNINSYNRNGSFGVKSWISSY